jgi:hypothetical protein
VTSCGAGAVTSPAIAQLLRFSPPIPMKGLVCTMQSRPTLEDGSRAERWQSLMQLSQEDLVAELGRYAGLLSADDPRSDLLRAMQRFLDAKQKESSGEEWDANAKMGFGHSGETVAAYFTTAARLMWLHALIIPRGYNGWIGEQTPEQSEIVANDISTPPHQSELWKRASQNYALALQHQPTNAESFIGKIMVDGEWLERWERFHKPAGRVAPPANDHEDGPLPAEAYLTGSALQEAVSAFYAEYRRTATADSEDYVATSLRFVHEKAWTRPTNQPVDLVAVEEAISYAPSAGLVLEFGVFEATTIRDLSLCMEQRHHELLASTAPSPPFLLNKIHGFDSFEGLPHDWDGRTEMKAGHFTLNGVIPRVFIECKLRISLFALPVVY